MSNITNNTVSSRFSEYRLNDYSTCKATANKAPSSTNRVVAAMQTTAYKVAAAFSFTAAFLSNVVLSIANLAIRAANFTHGRIFTKEAVTAKPVEIKEQPKQVLTIPYAESQIASEQSAETEKNADQTVPAVEITPKEESTTVVDTKQDEATSLPPARTSSAKIKEYISKLSHAVATNFLSARYG